MQCKEILTKSEFNFLGKVINGREKVGQKNVAPSDNKR